MTTDRTSKHKVTAGVKDGKLNIMFQGTQIPASGTPDVELYKDGNSVHLKISGKDVSTGAAAAETKAASDQKSGK